MKRGTCRNAADDVITSTHTAFRDQADFVGQLSKTGGNADLIEYICNDFVTNKVLRERLLKGIAEELPMKKDFDIFSDFLRDAADDMDAKGKPNEAVDQVASGHVATTANRFPTRGRGQSTPQSRGRGQTYPPRGGGYRPPSQQSATPSVPGRGRGMPTPAWMSGQSGQQSSQGGRGRGSSRGLRGQSASGSRGSARAAPSGGTRVRLITGEERPKRKVTYKIGEWDRDCLLEMIGVDPFDPRTQTEYHRRQGYNNLTPPLCIRRDVCNNLRHFSSTPV